MKKEYLLEIGCENLPSSYLPEALRQLEAGLAGGLKEERINYRELKVQGTPNRLVIHIAGLDDRQEDLRETVTGPPLSRALDDNGEYNRSALGFARSKGAGAEDIIRVEKKKGEYIAVEKKTPGMETGAVLSDKLPQWISEINFPRDMRWDRSGLTFARPVRWILSMLSDGELKLELGNLESGRLTRLKPYFNRYVEVSSIDHYFELIDEAGIIIDPERRTAAVRDAVEREAVKLKGRPVEDEELVSTVANLLESPVPIVGSYMKRFLSLPRRVIIAALKGHQKYFSVEDSGGDLLPCFISFADGCSDNLEEIARGNERVLQARLYDAEFYYLEDTSEPIAEMAKELEHIVWMRGMGTLAEKSERIGKLSVWMSREFISGDREMGTVLKRAAFLAKADLASEMVKDGKEFTKLQGYIGREYALKSGESSGVADAIFEHYLPRFAGDRLPASDPGIIISIADRLDNIAGGFLMGLNPTGSQDPYALRRQALGILRIMIEKNLSVPLRNSVEKSVSLFSRASMEKVGKSAEQAVDEIMEFCNQRFAGLLRGDGYGFDQDLVSAVISGGWKLPSVALKMIGGLSEMRKSGELGLFTTAMKRMANIIQDSAAAAAERDDRNLILESINGEKTEELPFDPELFEEEAEKDLYLSAVKASSDIIKLRKKGRLEGVFAAINSTLTGPVNRFFDEVMVNCEEKKVRTNRHSFLMALHKAFSYYCDYSLIQEE